MPLELKVSLYSLYSLATLVRLQYFDRILFCETCRTGHLLSRSFLILFFETVNSEQKWTHRNLGDRDRAISCARARERQLDIATFFY